MKKYTLLLFVFLCFILNICISTQSYSQTKKVALSKKDNVVNLKSMPSEFFATSEEECVDHSDKLLSLSSRKYAFSRKKNNSDNVYILYKEVTESEEPKSIEFVYSINTVGANPALEIEGKKEYKLNVILGAYLDLFPIWQKYFVPDANLEATSTQPTKWYELHIDDQKTIYPLVFEKSSMDGYFIVENKANRWDILIRNNRSRPY